MAKSLHAVPGTIISNEPDRVLALIKLTSSGNLSKYIFLSIPKKKKSQKLSCYNRVCAFEEFFGYILSNCLPERLDLFILVV